MIDRFAVLLTMFVFWSCGTQSLIINDHQLPKEGESVEGMCKTEYLSDKEYLALGPLLVKCDSISSIAQKKEYKGILFDVVRLKSKYCSLHHHLELQWVIDNSQIFFNILTKENLSNEEIAFLIKDKGLIGTIETDKKLIHCYYRYSTDREPSITFIINESVYIVQPDKGSNNVFFMSFIRPVSSHEGNLQIKGFGGFAFKSEGDIITYDKDNFKRESGTDPQE